MRITLVAATIISCFLFACNNSNDPKDTESNDSDSSLLNTVPTGFDTVTQVEPTDNTGAATPPGLTSTPGLTPSVPTQPAASTASGINPAHGEPGHRCDIPVGAPLNSPPGQKAAPSGPAAAPPPSPTPISAPSTATPPGMNPPHGQPGHDCAVAVGAPLPKK